MSDNDTNSRTEWRKSTSMLELSAVEAREFLLKHESYCNLDLPCYFVFDTLLRRVSNQINGKGLSDFQKENPRKYEDINYKIVNNKDGTICLASFSAYSPSYLRVFG